MFKVLFTLIMSSPQTYSVPSTLYVLSFILPPDNASPTLEEKYARLEAERNLLKAENELLTKIKLMEERMRKK